ncbi:MAG: LLM class flavin-dependent oxidoreductase [Cryobacterium sp.]|nr:LLM class flavin-dependent oxidoreductase [Cryobacterium sp.]
MVSYGQELKFGTFITPTSSDPERVIELAVASDRLGFDLASFQDHPYQPALLDAWSLIAFVAARTERISLSANVSNLPLRLPVLLARASATIDLLSNGRLELGIGAGGFWDAIEAVGGRRLEPGQAVEALGEAIQIIRELWNPDAPGPARFEGKFYSVSEAKRGPRTPHSIGIQIGAYKPKMLHLTGRLADGWIPSFGYLKSIESLAAMNAAIDEGAAAAGRNPSEIRRWINIGFDEAQVETMARLAEDYGISGFIVGTDKIAQLEAFMEERVPELRSRLSARQG